MNGFTYSRAVSELSQAIEKATASLGYKVQNAESTVEFSKGFGDFSSSISFRLAKELKKDANSIAKEIASKMEKPKFVREITVENGFLNFHLDKNVFAEMVLKHSENIGKHKAGKVIIEYPSVNPNKPWHIGHLRNALLGDSISNMYSALGFETEREDYIDDLGLQMAETLWWYVSNNGKPEKKFDHWLGEEYVKVNQHIGEESAKSGISNMMSLMSQDGTYESKLLRDVVTECVKAQYETAFNLSIFHDLLVWESDIVREKLLEKALHILKGHGFVETPKDGDYANCIVIDLKKIKDLPEEFKGLKEDVKVLVRSNGVPTYIAKDIAFHMWKFGIIENTFKYSAFMDRQPNGNALYTTGPEGKHMDFTNAKIAINIIDVRQSFPQSVLRLVFNTMGKKDEAGNIRHLAYGMVELESGALSGRKGTWQGYSADDLLRETEAKAMGLISSRFKLGKEEEQEIAKEVAIAAIKFEFLKVSPEKKIVFSWEKALNFEGNSGPYAQYMHARASRIMEEAPKELLKKGLQIQELNESEFSLIKLISKKGFVLEKAVKELRPNVITDYISELGYAFASFYENSPILKAESDSEKAFRIKLTAAFKDSMKNMLEVIGIYALEKM